MPKRVYTYSDAGATNGFSKENLFLGGSLALGFGSYNFNVGASPEIGYSLNSWLDAGVVVNFNYNSVRADLIEIIMTIHVIISSITGWSFCQGLSFTFPFCYRAAGIQLDTWHCHLHGRGGGEYSYTTGHPRCCLGGLWAKGRRTVQFYIALMFDVLGNRDSPYNDFNGHRCL